ncbi:MAG TPA: hypothetical protein VI793_00155 [Anaerolineales bacterium]|nr:hypothetical protein [Anaerolineales bacterium]
MTPHQRLPASFRDPSGFLFSADGILYRQVNTIYREHYDCLIGSGLYQSLTEAGFMLPHTEADTAPSEPALAYKVIQPELVPFISYPYEWSFSQLKAAALVTLAIQRRALKSGMSLKDGSAYNIQFQRGRPVLIDTLSFERHREGEPWTAYRQFCQHFLAPLALMAYCDVRLNQLLRVYLDGLPLELTSRLLPARTRLSFPLLLHLHLHAASERRYARQLAHKPSHNRPVSKEVLLWLIGSLESAIRGLRWAPTQTDWANYAAEHNYRPEALEHKRQLVSAFLDRVQPRTVWDLGANVGQFSRLASQRGVFTVAFDLDPGAVELNYRQCVAEGEQHLLPLWVDLTNPSPNLGWRNEERFSLLRRASAGAVLALALVHHLAIGNNVPLEEVAKFFSDLGAALIIEFVPKTDPQTQRLLVVRDDIFLSYTQEGFERAFQEYFTIQAVEPIRESERILYLMQRSA